LNNLIQRIIGRKLLDFYNPTMYVLCINKCHFSNLAFFQETLSTVFFSSTVTCQKNNFWYEKVIKQRSDKLGKDCVTYNLYCCWTKGHTLYSNIHQLLNLGWSDIKVNKNEWFCLCCFSPHTQDCFSIWICCRHCCACSTMNVRLKTKRNLLQCIYFCCTKFSICFQTRIDMKRNRSSLWNLYFQSFLVTRIATKNHLLNSKSCRSCRTNKQKIRSCHFGWIYVFGE
jgi:hypothetical protein